MKRAAAYFTGAVLAILVTGCATNRGGGAPSSSPSPSPSSAPGSVPSPVPVPKPGGSAEPEAPVPGNAETTSGGSAQTAQERRAEVDGKLDASLDTFDEQLKREQQRTAQERDARASGRAGSGGSDSAGAEDEPGGGPGGTGGRNSGRDRAGDLRSDRRTGESGTEPAGAPGEGAPGEGASLPGKGGGGAVSGRVIPDGSDDDIIARRLRKAAETETDPELKEKLWKEYIDYKSNARSGR